MARPRKTGPAQNASMIGLTHRTVRRRRAGSSKSLPDTRTYLMCLRRKGTPQVALDVCKVCRHNVKCRQYLNFRNPKLFS